MRVSRYDKTTRHHVKELPHLDKQTGIHASQYDTIFGKMAGGGGGGGGRVLGQGCLLGLIQ